MKARIEKNHRFNSGPGKISLCKPLLKHVNGLSLLEIMIGVFIIATAFIPILRLIHYGGKATVKVNNFSEVAKIAQGLIEECKHVPIGIYSKDYADLSDGQWFEVNPQYYPKAAQAVEEFRDSLKSLKINSELTVLRAPDENRIREIWIRVTGTWEEGDGTTLNKPRELRLANAIYNP